MHVLAHARTHARTNIDTHTHTHTGTHSHTHVSHRGREGDAPAHCHQRVDIHVGKQLSQAQLHRQRHAAVTVSMTAARSSHGLHDSGTQQSQSRGHGKWP